MTFQVLDEITIFFFTCASKTNQSKFLTFTWRRKFDTCSSVKVGIARSSLSLTSGGGWPIFGLKNCISETGAACEKVSY